MKTPPKTPTTTWDDGQWPPSEPVGVFGWLRAIFRAVPLAIVTFGGLALLLVLRLIEMPIFGLKRPVTPWITRFVCKSAFVILGVRHVVRGTPMTQNGAAVSNHSSWLDIFALNAPQSIYFVSKSEVAGWPGIGWLARATGTVFINRRARDAARQRAIFEARLQAGHHLLFFPEGTSTDGQRILPFKSTLFAAFFSMDLYEDLWIQPVTLIYTSPQGADPRFYGWWGEMEFFEHLLKTLAARHQGGVEVVYHAPLKVSDFPDRKVLAAACEVEVRKALPEA